MLCIILLFINYKKVNVINKIMKIMEN